MDCERERERLLGRWLAGWQASLDCGSARLGLVSGLSQIRFGRRAPIFS